MIYAKKENKRIRVNDNERKQYVVRGYDIIEVKDGAEEVLEHGHGKTVPYAKYQEALDKIAELEAKKTTTAKK